MPKVIQKAKIACLDFSLQKAKMHLGVQVVVEQPDKLEAIRDRCVARFSLVPVLPYELTGRLILRRSGFKRYWLLALMLFCALEESMICV